MATAFLDLAGEALRMMDRSQVDSGVHRQMMAFTWPPVWAPDTIRGYIRHSVEDELRRNRESW
jgi:hypothetical protein